MAARLCLVRVLTLGERLDGIFCRRQVRRYTNGQDAKGVSREWSSEGRYGRKACYASGKDRFRIQREKASAALPLYYRRRVMDTPRRRARLLSVRRPCHEVSL